jgi:putative endonuclease
MHGRGAEVGSIFLAREIMRAFVYMLQCADDSFYVGSATGDDLSAQHESGAYPGYTYSRRPVRLVWSEHFEQITDAIAIERKLKGWSRKKKEALIKGDWSEISRNAKRRTGRPKE